LKSITSSEPTVTRTPDLTTVSNPSSDTLIAYVPGTRFGAV
jgi:hypothetical protein